MVWYLWYLLVELVWYAPDANALLCWAVLGCGRCVERRMMMTGEDD